MILNLDQNFRPIEGEEILFEKMTFSGGEPHIKIKSTFAPKTKVTVTCRLNTFQEIGFLLLATDALLRMEAQLDLLFIPYFPAARQDRIMVPGEPLSVKVNANLINQLQYNRVWIYDAHSEVTGALLNNCTIIPNHQFIQSVMATLTNNPLLISPDGGALKKIYKVAEFLGGKEVVECSKSRDVKTGKLTGFKVYSDDLLGRDCLIVDDICDGGGTFIGLAKELKAKNAGKIYLAASHGIFSKGLDGFTEFEKIFTTNSFREIEHEWIEQTMLRIKF